MVVKRRGVEVLSRGEFLHLPPPLGKQGRALLADELRQCMQVIANLLLSWRVPVSQAVSARIAQNTTEDGARYWVRTSDPYRVKVVLYH